MAIPHQQSFIFKGIYEFDDPSGTIIAARVPHDGTADLFSGTTINVRPNQNAMFVYKGKIADILPEGLHQVETKNFPIITRIANWKFGFTSPLRCGLWFFTTSTFVARRWGTVQPVIHDFPDYKAVPIRGYGNFNIVAVDPKSIYTNLIGSRTTYDITDLESFVQAQITENLPQALNVVPNLESLNKQQDAVSEKLQKLVNKVLKQYGFKLLDLQVMSLTPSKEILQALSAQAAMKIIGNKQEYLLYKAANSLEEIQAGGEHGGRANDPMQMMLGLMLGKSLLASDFREKERVIVKHQEEPKAAIPHAVSYCQNCGGAIREADKFCSSCGTKVKKK